MIYDKIAGDYDHFMRDQLSRASARVTRLELEARGFAPPQRILDVACGTGMISKRLHEAGHQVTGIDLSGPMLDLAKERFPRGDGPRFVQTDLTLYQPPERFPVVLCFGDVLNHFAEPHKAQDVVKKLFDFLAPGGLLVADTNTLETYRSELWNREETENQGRQRVTTRARFEEEEGLAYLELSAHRRLGKGEPLYQESLTERYYPDQQVRGWMEDVGFTQVQHRVFNPIPDLTDISEQKTLWLAEKE